MAVSSAAIEARYEQWAQAPPVRFSPGLKPRFAAWSAELAISDPTLNRSLVSDGPATASLVHFLRLLKSGRRDVHVAVLGGSVTYGHGIDEHPMRNYSWPAQLERALRHVWHPRVSVHNAAMPATTAAATTTARTVMTLPVVAWAAATEEVATRMAGTAPASSNHSGAELS